MKKTLTINISGLVFHIDEDAYDVLRNYIEQISAYFINEEESREIISDVESRIAELFQENLKDKNQVVTIGLINQVIDRLGKPEDFAQEGNESEESYHKNYRTNKRMFRDPDSRVLGGVCSGMGAYFQIDPLVIRIIFLVLFFGFGTGLIIYLVLWIVIPAAETTAQKLQMRGEPVNLHNIKRSVKDEFDNVKEKYNL